MPTVTAGDIIQDALELLGVYSPGMTVTAADSSRCLSVLSDLMDVWSNESLACYDWLTQTFTLVPGVSQYTVGPGGTIAGQRPIRISDAAGAAYLLDQNQNRYLMDVLDNQTWNIQTTFVSSSDLPTSIFYDPQFPLGILNVWPTPITGYTCSFMSYSQLGDFATLQSPFSLPPGYKRAITTNLCLSLKPYFANAQIDPLIVQEAMQTKGAIKRSNMRTQISVMDPELVSRGTSTYNIYNDRGTGRNS